MLWSLIKIVVFVALIAALTLGAGYLLDNDGTGLAQAQIVLNGQEYTLGPIEMIIGSLIIVAGLWVLFKLVSLLIAILRFINGDETAVSRYFDRNRERKGFQALSEGLMALASGEGRLAIAKAEKANKYLRKPELTDLITAQAAELTGDRDKAEKIYKRLVQNDTTRFVGVRGLMKQKLAEGDTDTALKLAEKAFAIKPKHEEVQDVLLKLQAGAADWRGARATLATKLKTGTLPRDVHKRRDAVLALSEAKDILDEGKSDEARETAITAAKKSPDLIPAVAMAARSYIEQQRPRLAVRMLKKAWEIEPHPDLAAAFAAIEPTESAEDRLKRFQQLTKIKPDHPETRMLLAELNIAAEDFPAARRAMGDLADVQPDARVLTIMAAIERGEGASDAVVRGWLARALTAPRGQQWVCDNCKHIHSNWGPVCENCGGFDTLSWTTPPQSEVALPGGAEMLPLLVGPTDPAPEPDLPVAADVEIIDPVIPVVEDAATDPEDKAADTPPEAEETPPEKKAEQA
ncbi:heme biosynthesis HemY N-terminal domain-containing protein [Mesobacterium sp. TK19101]|uniref:Heme biosynthesis HemY N-terminal domain-containing protein n=1 Tax=Mesobacterium hydrothermale TaxID=3111907 RepID=A0ABU6HIC0_9RHOB|nr:heme biosynthesis HemY N-terminal domain-containing protein [Mesobacterium sp. TK19101]MEC3861580.1 heme biosynthesis HemY N-terminal domain-containing protein [Mesobacterium sp. TK19101]